jgi:NAD(P)-dependent dehydrogenase (short-subunit alcohol dehydrogenase family)
MDKSVFALTNKTILVLGASSGIGRCVARVCAEFGATVILHGRDEIKLQETRDQLQPSDHLIFSKNINDDDFESQLKELIKDLRLSGVFFGIGIHRFTPIRFTKNETVTELLESNLISAFKIIRFISKIAKKDNHISAVFMSSIASVSSETGISIYSASKAALNSLVKSSAKELATHSVRLNSISAGFVDTEMFQNISKNLSDEQLNQLMSSYPLGIGIPEDIAYLALYLLSDASRWVTGSNFVIDGGATL